MRTLREWLTSVAERHERVSLRQFGYTYTFDPAYLLSHERADVLDEPVTEREARELYAPEGKVLHLARPQRWWQTYFWEEQLPSQSESTT